MKAHVECCERIRRQDGQDHTHINTSSLTQIAITSTHMGARRVWEDTAVWSRSAAVSRMSSASAAMRLKQLKTWSGGRWQKILYISMCVQCYQLHLEFTLDSSSVPTPLGTYCTTRATKTTLPSVDQTHKGKEGECARLLGVTSEAGWISYRFSESIYRECYMRRTYRVGGT